MSKTLAALALATGLGLGLGQSPAAAQTVTQPVVSIVDITVNSVGVIAGQLVANATVTLDVVGRQVEQAVLIPLELTATDSGGECPILNLALGPIDLNLLGLVVELDDCNGGPVTIDITAYEGGGLLGDLLCAVANLLNGGLDLGSILAGGTAIDPTALTSALSGVLNDFFGQLLGQVDDLISDGVGVGGPGGRRRCDILNLELGPIDLELLGLEVLTSEICLQVYAVPGPGNLLGNLLCQLVDLLNAPGSRVRQIAATVQDIFRILDRLGL